MYFREKLKRLGQDNREPPIQIWFKAIQWLSRTIADGWTEVTGPQSVFYSHICKYTKMLGSTL